jgi:trehalose 6-phosphate synthase/phosphatase
MGVRLRRDAEWETCIQVADCSWKQIADPVMQLYTETTDGSTIEDRETALVWSYEDADPDFGSCQAKELLDHLESVLVNEPVLVKSGPNIVEVKPQVLSLSLSLSLFWISLAEAATTGSLSLPPPLKT